MFSVVQLTALLKTLDGILSKTSPFKMTLRKIGSKPFLSFLKIWAR